MPYAKTKDKPATTHGWSIARRREAFNQVVDALIAAGLSRTEALVRISEHTGKHLNTVQGWASFGEKQSRKPPQPETLEILMLRTGLLTLEPLTPGLELPAPRQTTIRAVPRRAGAA